ncbi:sulfotransferase-like domain-containing protein [Granulosicoccus sp. 3-233]|uniref:sulfotransferase-like domain-containing protein n=1 Tax=Granulosicoccus sp. 3-233 TaxID=3417969 RepID=UPI003D32F75B
MSGRCIAMWSGPRNISTAMMRAWENRDDTVVVDEPFYAHYLQSTGLDHPMREEVIASGETDWQAVVQSLIEPPASGIYYQKHIATHWLPHFTTEWLDSLDHVFLIREPEPVVASYSIKREGLTATDLGYEQQDFLFDLLLERTGARPAVIDSKRFLADPEAQLRSLCTHLDIAFDTGMLCWPAGARDSDGVWGAHWYDAVNASTGFAPARNKELALTEDQLIVARACRPYYERLREHAI